DRSNSPAAARLVSALSSRSFQGSAALSLADDSSIIFASYTPDGQRVLIWNRENQLRLWNPVTGLPLSPPLQHPAAISDVKFTAGSEDILSLVQDDALYLWNGRNGAQIARFPLGSGLYLAAAHPSNQIVVAAFTNGHVIAFDPRAPERRREWAAHPNPVGWLEFSRDGRFLVTCSTSTNSGVKVWSGQEPFPLLAELAHSTNSVQLAEPSPDGSQPFRFDFSPPRDKLARPSPDGSHLFTVDATGMAQFWKLPAGPLVGATNLPGFASAAEFSPDSSRLLVGTEEGLVLVFDPRTGAELLRYTKHSQSFLSVLLHTLAVGPDNRRVLSGSFGGAVHLWDLQTGEPLCEPIRVDRMTAAVQTVQLSPDGRQILSWEADLGMRLWKLLPAPAAPLRLTEAEGVRAVAFTTAGAASELLTVSTNGGVRVRDWHTGALLRTLREPGMSLEYAEFDAASRFLALAATNHTVTLLELASGAAHALETPDAGQVRWVDFSRDGQRVAVAAADSVFVCDTSTGRLVAGPLECPGDWLVFKHEIYRVRFSPDGTRLVTACHDLHALVWDIASGHVLANFLHVAPVFSAEFSPDGSAVLTASFDQSAWVWHLTNTATATATAKAFRVFRHPDQLSEARFSPDGRQVVAACTNGTAIVWDIATAARLAEPLTHRRFVHGAEFDRSGTRILTRSGDGTFRLWQARTGLPLGEPFDVGAKPLAIATTPDWTTFAACTGGREVRVWEEPPLPLPVPDWLPELAEAIAGKRLNTTNNAEQAVPAPALPALQARLSALSPTNAWNRWARWYVADPGQRPRTWPQ
ncbi:MAG: WD40 repeat domain-containing protein, partial [bacterium]